jgi:FlgD Ig-like domain
VPGGLACTAGTSGPCGGPTPRIRSGVARYAPAALVAALLVATAVAFVYTEKLKLTRSPIVGTRVDKVFSPVCDCETDTAQFSFRLREADIVGIQIIDRGDAIVRELVRARHAGRGGVTFTWNGRDDEGLVVPEGRYRPRVHLSRERRTIVLPNPIRVDVTPPRIELRSLRPRVFSPDGDHRRDGVEVGYRVDEAARVSLVVDGQQRVRKAGQKQEGTIPWFGLVDGKPLPRGVYRLELGATDIAGNLAVRTPAKPVVIRYVALVRKRIQTAPGRRFGVRVLSDAARVKWRFGTSRGEAPPGRLKLRAPPAPGRYRLTVIANGHRDRGVVIVRVPAR